MTTIDSLKKRLLPLEEREFKVKLGVIIFGTEQIPDKEALNAEKERMRSEEGYTNFVVVEILSLEEELQKKRLSCESKGKNCTNYSNQ